MDRGVFQPGCLFFYFKWGLVVYTVNYRNTYFENEGALYGSANFDISDRDCGRF